MSDALLRSRYGKPAVSFGGKSDRGNTRGNRHQHCQTSACVAPSHGSRCSHLFRYRHREHEWPPRPTMNKQASWWPHIKLSINGLKGRTLRITGICLSASTPAQSAFYSKPMLKNPSRLAYRKYAQFHGQQLHPARLTFVNNQSVPYRLALSMQHSKTNPEKVLQLLWPTVTHPLSAHTRTCPPARKMTSKA